MTRTEFEGIICYTSAKIVLVGERNVGKSCLAARLMKYQRPNNLERSTEHGIQFWHMALEQLDPDAVASEGQRRDVVLWDIGGRDAYQLVNQLFLHDSTLVLVLMDLTRGVKAFEEAKAWDERLEKQMDGRSTAKLLVISKMDDPNGIADEDDIQHMCQSCGFHDYYEASAFTGRGIPELRKAISETLDWHKLAKTSCPKLFLHIRDEIDRRRDQGEIVLPVADLEKAICNADLGVFNSEAIGSVVEQLAAQGVVVDTWMTSGERTLVLKIEEIERYAGALVTAARSNPLGVSALRQRDLTSPDVSLPGIEAGDRLPRLQEKGVLECVTQLLVEHDICFQHEGLLIFPSLFRQVRKSDMEALYDFMSLQYDSSGVIDENFGRDHMLLNRARFRRADKGYHSIRKIDPERALAHVVDVEFDREKTFKTLDQTERLELSCPSCAYQFPEDILRKRIAMGETDVGCPTCDKRVLITLEAARVRERDPKLGLRVSTLRRRSADSDPIRVLHLSDLHFRQDTDVRAALRPLVVDIRDENGLGFRSLDYLVISGDMSDCAAPEEFEKARQFISELIKNFDLAEERCILVPGNHDQSWDEEVYCWQQRRRVDIKQLKDGHYREEGGGYLIRDDKRYSNRFRNFSEFLYYPLMQVPYPLSFDKQGISYLFEDTGIQFLALNSCWEIDEWFHDRASIHEGTLARGLDEADDQIMDRVDEDASVLRIAVWHHPIAISSGIENCSFMEHLKQARFRLVLHGHVHEERATLLYHLYPESIHVAGTGSFGAPANARPESTPRLYNLLEVACDHSWIRVHTRCRRRQDGSWKAWTVWPTEDPDIERPYYDIPLN